MKDRKKTPIPVKAEVVAFEPSARGDDWLCVSLEVPADRADVFPMGAMVIVNNYDGGPINLSPHVTLHALQRFREQYPTAERRDLLAVFAEAYPAPVGLVLAVAYPERIRRARERHARDCLRRREWFAVAADHGGAFALRPAVDAEGRPAPGWAIVTYLRFDAAQAAHLRYLLDGEEAA